MLSFHKGYFFYFHLLRKDLLGKYLVFTCNCLPRLERLQFSVRSHQEQTIFSDRLLWSWWMLTELFCAHSVHFQHCDIYQADHLLAYPNVLLSSQIVGRRVYEPFFNLYFGGFRGLYSNLADPVSVSTLTSISSSPTSPLLFGPIMTRLAVKVEYFTYARPKFKFQFSLFAQLLVVWSDFTFYPTVPPALAALGAETGARWQLVGVGSPVLFSALFRGLRLLHRLDPMEPLRWRRAKGRRLVRSSQNVLLSL